MRKFIILIVLHVIALFIIFPQETIGWNDMSQLYNLTISGSCYGQIRNGEDLDNTYSCLLLLFVKSDNSLSFGIACSELIMDKKSDVKQGFCSIKLRKDNTRKSFDGNAIRNGFITVTDNEALRVYELLKSGGVWEILVEGNGWYLRTSVSGDNLPEF